ncbi:MAG: Panacea domain-containing protein [Pirellulales bacterium]
MRLLKLLYLAERKSLQESGGPLTGSPAVAMERGPVLEDVFSLIRQKHPDTPVWSNFFRPDRYELVMISDPGNRRLTPFIVDVLNAVSALHEEHDEHDMVDITHTLPEWLKNNPGKSCRPIPLEDILEAVGRADDIDEIIAFAQQCEATILPIQEIPRTDTGEPASF